LKHGLNRDRLKTAGYSPAYGARPLNRVITNELLNPLSRFIIEEAIRDGETARITVDHKANRLVVLPNHESVFRGDDMDLDDMADGEDIEIEEMD
jgi:ATP-dependent Clp protease ATP-binding subunit ClpB